MGDNRGGVGKYLSEFPASLLLSELFIVYWRTPQETHWLWKVNNPSSSDTLISVTLYWIMKSVCSYPFITHFLWWCWGVGRWFHKNVKQSSLILRKKTQITEYKKKLLVIVHFNNYLQLLKYEWKNLTKKIISFICTLIVILCEKIFTQKETFKVRHSSVSDEWILSAFRCCVVVLLTSVIHILHLNSFWQVIIFF